MGKPAIVSDRLPFPVRRSETPASGRLPHRTAMGLRFEIRPDSVRAGVPSWFQRHKTGTEHTGISERKHVLREGVRSMLELSVRKGRREQCFRFVL